ncbi:hypothetical protein AmaxDRAFT_1168 [Limnospira maxima CS-328]|uniref:Uncharacterized protein n=1 Tax=Limnospira maxima CS-328 TaxID=513049 RepID=B5VXC6_LIMMA|nr:hypothetical protein AmaxDRAFT_1168 [Limnospira maxima CS-328]
MRISLLDTEFFVGKSEVWATQSKTRFLGLYDKI